MDQLKIRGEWRGQIRKVFGNSRIISNILYVGIRKRRAETIVQLIPEGYTATITIPIYNQIVSIKSPKGFGPAYEKAASLNYINEMVITIPRLCRGMVTKESFFTKAFVLGGPGMPDKVKAFKQSTPTEVDEKIALGLKIAEQFKNTDSYDRHWPAVYDQVVQPTGVTSSKLVDSYL